MKLPLSLLIVLIGCTGNQQTSKGGLQTDSGLRIENGINRGTRYTDSLGTIYGITYIPISITNDSTIPMHIQIAFSNEYNFPHPDSDEKFKLIPLPKEWALDGVGITESMINKLPNYIDKPLLNETIESGEEIVIAIGTLRPVPTNCSPIPNVLFAYSDSDNFKACDSLMNKDKSTNPRLALGVKLDYCGGRCILIPCGQVSYTEN